MKKKEVKIQLFHQIALYQTPVLVELQRERNSRSVGWAKRVFLVGLMKKVRYLNWALS